MTNGVRLHWLSVKPSPWTATKIQRIVNSFWFIPTVCVLCALVLAEMMVRVDQLAIATGLPQKVPFFFQIGVDGSRGLLSGIGSSTFAAAATAFSITISVIATASTSYGPRLVGNFMSNRRNQWVLGVLVSTFVYTTLSVRYLRSATSDGEAFVPALTVHLAIVLAMVDVFLLIAFIHQIATSIQMEDLTSRSSDRFVAAAENFRASTDTAEETEGITWPTGGTLVTAGRAGYVADLNTAALLEAAHADRGTVVTLARIGDHIVSGTPLARILPGTDANKLAQQVREAFSVDRTRQYTDITYAQQQVVELAVRALSPGTNDPYTAVTAIDELGVGMADLVSHPQRPSVLVGPDDLSRVFVRRATLKELIDLAFEEIFHSATGQFQVWQALVRLAATIERANIHHDLIGYAWAKVGRMREGLEKANPGALPLLDAEITRVAETLPEATLNYRAN